MAAKKASKGKRGCLKPNGKLKKGWRYAKSRKGYCMPTKSAAKKKKAGKKKTARKSTKRSAAAKKAAATRKARAAARYEASREAGYPIERTSSPSFLDTSKLTAEDLKAYSQMGALRRYR